MDEDFALYAAQAQVLCGTPANFDKAHAAFINFVRSGDFHKTCAYPRRHNDFVNS